MAAYLWRYGWIDSPTFIAEQGHWMSQPGKGFVEVVGDRDDIQTIRVGGSAVTVIRGLFYS
jgi:trans-2,3-dihydro-3-hydroxyanthranilate isomerase